MAVSSIEIIKQGMQMTIRPQINLDEKTPEELRRLLNLVLTGPMAVSEKDLWVQKIQNKLGAVVRDPERERKILADIDAGKADTDDICN